MNQPRIVNYDLYIRGVFGLEFDSFKDERGYNFEGFNHNYLKRIPALDLIFKVDSFSKSRKWTLRGFHGDRQNHKLVQCLSGRIQLILLDARPNSSSYGKTLDIGVTSGVLPKAFILPPGVLNAHLCLSEECIFFYKLTYGYVPITEQIHVKWNSPNYNISWMGNSKDFILSERDK